MVLVHLVAGKFAEALQDRMEGRKLPGGMLVRATEKLLWGTPLKLWETTFWGNIVIHLQGSDCECPAHQPSATGAGRAKYTEARESSDFLVVSLQYHLIKLNIVVPAAKKRCFRIQV